MATRSSGPSTSAASSLPAGGGGSGGGGGGGGGGGASRRYSSPVSSRPSASPAPARHGRILVLGAVVIVGGVMAGLGTKGFWTLVGPNSNAAHAGLAVTTNAAARTSNEGPTAAELTDALLRAGLDPSALATAGVTSSAAVNRVVDDVRAYLVDHPSPLSSGDAAFASARADADRLQRLVQSGQGSQNDVAACASALSTLSAAQANRQTVVDAVYSAGAASLSASQLASMALIRSNRQAEPARDLPTQYLVIARQQSEWVSLRDALSNQHIAGAAGEQMDSSCLATLNNANGNSEVSTATSNLVSSLSSVTTAWNARVNQ